jgi:hypothetical protein
LRRSIEGSLLELGARVEADMRAHRPDAVLHQVSWTGDPESRAMGGEVFFSDRGNKRLPLQWVPGDPRRHGRTDLGYAVGHPAYAPAPAGIDAGSVEAAIDRAMATWADQRCSQGLAITKGSLQQWLDFESDILHAGFEPMDPGVIGVTFGFAFPDDLDGDGAADFAFAYILYNSIYVWGIDGAVDVESIALHEGGHGLAQGHFGAAFGTLANGKVHFAPRAVMNAAYTGVQQSLTGTDRAGHCGMYGSWPNR